MLEWWCLYQQTRFCGHRVALSIPWQSDGTYKPIDCPFHVLANKPQLVQEQDAAAVLCHHVQDVHEF